MGFHYEFSTVDGIKDLRLLTDFLLLQSLGYPRYEDWVSRLGHQIESGQKTAVMALSDGVIIGDVIFQHHRELARVRELKNMRVHPRLRDRGFGSFLLRQAEVENPDYNLLMCDVRHDQEAVIRLLRRNGYRPIMEVPLYDNHTLDVIMVKNRLIL